MNKLTVRLFSPLPPVPEWMKPICWHRKLFRSAALILDWNTPGEKVLAFMFGMQQPLVAAFASMKRIPVVWPAPSQLEGPELLQNLDDVWPHVFELEFNKPVWAWTLGGITVDCAHVLRLLEFGEHGRVSSPASPVPFEDVYHGLPPPRGGGQGGGGGGGGGRKRKAMGEEAEGDEPMSDEEDEEDDEGEVAPVGDDVDEDVVGDTDMDLDELAGLSKFLEEKRVTWAEARGQPARDFHCTVRGGVWTKKVRGIGADVASAWAVGDDARAWAETTVGNEMASFSLKKYSEQIAGNLSIYWADRLQYFYDLHSEGLCDTEGRLPFALIDAAPQPHTLRSLLSALPDSHPGWERLRGIERLSPPGVAGWGFV